PIRGQVTQLPATSSSKTLETVLCAEGYISPARHDEHHAGASFRLDRLDTAPSSEEHHSHLQLIGQLLPELAGHLQFETLDADRLPHAPPCAALHRTTCH